MFTPDIDPNHLQFALDHVPSYVSIKDRDSRYLYANRLTLELLGCTRQQLTGKNDNDFYSDDTALRLRNIDRRVLGGERRIEEVVTEDTFGRQLIYWISKTPIYEDADQSRISGILSIATDITLQKRLEEQLVYAAEIDILTGLFNRRKLVEHLELALNRGTRQSAHGCLMRIHVDNFDHLTDTYGHTVGDQLLMTVADCLQQNVRTNDTLARYGGSEFVLLLEDLAPEFAIARRQAHIVADKLTSNLQQPLAVGGQEISAAVSLEVTMFQGAETTADALLGGENAVTVMSAVH